MFEEWTAWFVVRERERELQRRRLLREAERAREQAARRHPPRPPQAEGSADPTGRKKAA